METILNEVLEILEPKVLEYESKDENCYFYTENLLLCHSCATKSDAAILSDKVFAFGMVACYKCKKTIGIEYSMPQTIIQHTRDQELSFLQNAQTCFCLYNSLLHFSTVEKSVIVTAFLLNTLYRHQYAELDYNTFLSIIKMKYGFVPQ